MKVVSFIDDPNRRQHRFDLVVIPGAGHGAAGTLYGGRRQRDFLVKHLLGVTPRWSAP